MGMFEDGIWLQERLDRRVAAAVRDAKLEAHTLGYDAYIEGYGGNECEMLLTLYPKGESQQEQPSPLTFTEKLERDIDALVLVARGNMEVSSTLVCAFFEAFPHEMITTSASTTLGDMLHKALSRYHGIEEMHEDLLDAITKPLQF